MANTGCRAQPRKSAEREYADAKRQGRVKACLASVLRLRLLRNGVNSLNDCAGRKFQAGFVAFAGFVLITLGKKYIA